MTVAVAELVGSATLVAATVTVWELEIEAGAVYRPAALMLPTTGLSDHVTLVVMNPPMGKLPKVLAVNC